MTAKQQIKEWRIANTMGCLINVIFMMQLETMQRKTYFCVKF